MENNKQDFIELYEKHKCLVSTACAHAKISRQTFYNWIKNDSEFKENIELLDQQLIDWAEEQLYNKVKDGDTHSIFFLLKAKAKKRGYGDEVQENKFVFKVKIQKRDE